MRLLFVNTTFNIGSTGKLTRNFLEYAYAHGDIVACVFADGQTPEHIDGCKLKSNISRKFTIIIERLTGLISCCSPFSTNKACRFIDSFNPDVVYFGNLHGYYINAYKLYRHIKKRGIPCVQIMWDEYPMTGSCAFSFDCKKYETCCEKCSHQREYPSSWLFDTSKYHFKMIRRSYMNDNIVFVSVPYVVSLAEKSILLGGKKLFPVDEAIDQKNLFYPREVSHLRNELNIPKDNIVILTVGYYPSERKGCKYFLELARSCESIKNLSFVHVGFMGDKNECPSNYVPIGFVNDQVRLAEFYSLGDLFICTSFAETQPNTCLEALSCGTKICGFNISGIPTCADAPFGEYVEPRNVDALKEIVLRTTHKDGTSIKQTKLYAQSRFSSDDYNARLLNIGYKLVNK